MGSRKGLPRPRREEPFAGRGSVVPWCGRLSPPHPGKCRSPDPAVGIPDQLHAVPARDRAGHAAASVRVPDPGRHADRHGSRQCLDVRRRDRLRRGGADGQAPDPAAACHPVGRAASALSRLHPDHGRLRRPWRRDPAARSRRYGRPGGAAGQGRRLRRRPVSRRAGPGARPDRAGRGGACGGRAADRGGHRDRLARGLAAARRDGRRHRRGRGTIAWRAAVVRWALCRPVCDA